MTESDVVLSGKPQYPMIQVSTPVSHQASQCRPSTPTVHSCGEGIRISKPRATLLGGMTTKDKRYPNTSHLRHYGCWALYSAKFSQGRNLSAHQMPQHNSMTSFILMYGNHSLLKDTAFMAVIFPTGLIR